MADAGLAPQSTSLMRVFQPRIRQMEVFLGSRLRELEEVSTWDPNAVNHSALLVSVKHLRQQEEKWRHTQGHLMQSLWLEQTKRYNSYRYSVAAALKQRHIDELSYLFPQLRYAVSLDPYSSGTEKADAAKGKEQQAIREFLVPLGFKFNRRSKKLYDVVKRQMEERSVLDKVVARHLAALQSGQEADMGRLQKGLKRVQNLCEQCAVVTEQKVTFSHQSSAAPSLYRRQQQRGHAPQAPPPLGGAAGAPRGSALDRAGDDSPRARGSDSEASSPRARESEPGGEAEARPPVPAVTSQPVVEDEYGQELQDILHQATRGVDMSPSP